MTENDPNPTPANSNLRRYTEDKDRASAAQTLANLSPEETRQVLHKLQVHQIELEMQNEELRRTRVELEASRARYYDLYDLAPVGYVTLNASGLILEANLTAGGLLGLAKGVLLKQLLTRFIVPEDQDIYSRQRQQLFETGAPQVCELRLTHAGATPIWVQLEMTSTQDPATGSGQAADDAPVCRAVMSNITPRKQAEQVLRERVETHAYEQAKLLEISHTLAASLEFQPGVLLDQLRGLIGYTQAGIFTLEDSALIVVAMRGSQQLEQSRPFRVHLKGPEILAALFNAHQPICIADVWSDSPPAVSVRSLLEDGAAALLKGMRSWMWIPLAVKGRLLGGLGLAHEAQNYFHPHHADLALRAAYQAAIAIINAELYGHAQALAAMEERQRLAHSLHDAINQSLFSAGLIAEVLPRLWERDQAEARRSLEDLRRLIHGAQAEMRTLLVELRPSMLIDSNLSDLLRLLGSAFSGRTNIPVAINITGEQIPPSQVQVAFYRICQEALNNVAKHARASQVEINLIQEEAVTELRVHDDGQGFDPQQSFSGHSGLSMMREHAESVGALLSVTSQPDHGTALTLRWAQTPLREAI